MQNKQSKFRIALLISIAILLIFWIKSFIWLSPLLKGTKDNEFANVGVFGDFFGCFNSLVSLLGFVAILYSMHKANRDDRRAEARHEETAKIALYEKRYEVYAGIQSLIRMVSIRGIESTKELIVEREKIQFHSLYLFPNGQKLFDLIKELENETDKIVNDTPFMYVFTPQSLEGSTREDELLRWHCAMTEKFIPLVMPHLLLRTE